MTVDTPAQPYTPPARAFRRCRHCGAVVLVHPVHGRLTPALGWPHVCHAHEEDRDGNDRREETGPAR